MAAKRLQKNQSLGIGLLKPAARFSYALEAGVPEGQNYLFSRIIQLPGQSPPPPDDDASRREIKRKLRDAVRKIDDIFEYFIGSPLPGVVACSGALGDAEEIRDDLQRAQIVAQNIHETKIAVKIEQFVKVNKNACVQIRLLGDELSNGKVLNKRRHSKLAEDFIHEMGSLKHNINDMLSRI